MARDLRMNVDADASGARRGLDTAARAVDDLADETRRLQRQFAEASREASKLDRKLLETKAAAAALGREFAKTQDKSLLSQIEAHNKAAGEIKRVQATIVGDSEKRAKEAAKAWHKAFDDLGDIGGHGSGFSGLPGRLAAALADSSLPLVSTLAKHPALAAAATPVIAGTAVLAGATAGGAVTAGIGAGVAGAGIAGAAIQSQKVRDEWASTTADIKSMFLDATTSFEGPTVAAIGKIGAAFRAVDLKATFADASKFVEPLADSAAKALQFIGDGVEYIVARGGPAVTALANGIQGLGEATKIALQKIGDGSDGGAKALDDVFTAISDLVILTGTWIGWFEDAYAATKRLTDGLREMHPVFGAIADQIDEWTGNKKVSQLSSDLDLAAIRAHTFGETGQAAFYGLDQKARDSLATVDRMNQAFDDLKGNLLGLSNANIAVAADFGRIKKELEGGAHALDINYQKGQDNLRLINDTIGDLMRQRDAAIAAGGGTEQAYDKARDAYNKQVAALEAMVAQILHSKDAAHALFAEFYDRTVNVTVKIRKVGDTSIEGVISSGDMRRSAGSGYASGTRSAVPGLHWVGERGRPELVDFRGGERVFNPSESARIMAGYARPDTSALARYATSAGSSARSAAPTLVYKGGSPTGLESMFLSWLMKKVQNGDLALVAS